MMATQVFVRNRFVIGAGLSWLAMLFGLAGCLPETVKLSPAAQSAISSIRVVALESPPLEVMPDLLTRRMPVYRHYHNMVLPFSPEVGLYRNPGGILISGRIGHGDNVTKVNLSNLETDADDTWTPTRELSAEAVSLLNAAGIDAVEDHRVRRLPWMTPEHRADLVSWRNAVERWYVSDSAELAHRRLAGSERSDAVLEVGVGRYKIFDGQVSLEVLVKLIDSRTGVVIARSSATTRALEAPTQALLDHEGERFKTVIREIGTRLLSQGFHEIGLMPKRLSSPSLPIPS